MPRAAATPAYIPSSRRITKELRVLLPERQARSRRLQRAAAAPLCSYLLSSFFTISLLNVICFQLRHYTFFEALAGFHGGPLCQMWLVDRRRQHPMREHYSNQGKEANRLRRPRGLWAVSCRLIVIVAAPCCFPHALTICGRYPGKGSQELLQRHRGALAWIKSGPCKRRWRRIEAPSSLGPDTSEQCRPAGWGRVEHRGRTCRPAGAPSRRRLP